MTERRSVAVVKLSQSLSEPGNNPVYVIGDGSQQVPWFAVRAEETRLTRHLATASYGDVLCISDGLILWNADEEGYNLVVDGATVIDRITPDQVMSA